MNKEPFDEVKEPILEKKDDNFCIWFVDFCCCCFYTYDLS